MMSHRLIRSVLIGSSLACVSAAYAGQREMPSDFAQLWHAARAWLAGIDPYSVVGPDKAFVWDFPLLYPMPAVLVAVPFALLPLWLADALFIGTGSGLLAWGLMRDRLDDPRLLVFISGAGALAIQTSQWSPLLCATALLPVLAPLLACKPTLGLALLVWSPSWRTLAGMAGFGIVSLLAFPAWPWRWLEALPSATHMSAPILRPGGFVLLLLLIAWRSPDARLLLALSCVPHTPVLYEAVPLFLVVKTWRESIGLTVLTIAVGVAVKANGPYGGYQPYMTAYGVWMLWLLYVPCAVVVLHRAVRARVWNQSDAAQTI